MLGDSLHTNDTCYYDLPELVGGSTSFYRRYMICFLRKRKHDYPRQYPRAHCITQITSAPALDYDISTDIL